MFFISSSKSPVIPGKCSGRKRVINFACQKGREAPGVTLPVYI